MRRAFALFSVLAILAMFPLSHVWADKEKKVDICHITGNGSGHVINVSGNAIPAHLAHGDCLNFVQSKEGDDCRCIEKG